MDAKLTETAIFRPPLVFAQLGSLNDPNIFSDPLDVRVKLPQHLLSFENDEYFCSTFPKSGYVTFYPCSVYDWTSIWVRER